MTRAFVRAGGIVSLSLVVACGGAPSSGGSTSGSSGASTARRDPCTLLTAEDIQSALGTAAGKSRFESNQCIWPSADGSNQFLVQLLVTVSGFRSYDELARRFREELGADAGDSIHPIEGVGRFGVGFNDMAMVQIFTDDEMVQVSAMGHEEKQVLELARRAVARLD